MLTSEDLVAQDAIRFYSGDAAVGITGITPFTANLDRPEMQAFVAGVPRPYRQHRRPSGESPRTSRRWSSTARSPTSGAERHRGRGPARVDQDARGGVRRRLAGDRPVRCAFVSDHRGRIQPAGQGLLHRGAGGRRQWRDHRPARRDGPRGVAVLDVRSSASSWPTRSSRRSTRRPRTRRELLRKRLGVATKRPPSVWTYGTRGDRIVEEWAIRSLERGHVRRPPVHPGEWLHARARHHEDRQYRPRCHLPVDGLRRLDRLPGRRVASCLRSLSVAWSAGSSRWRSTRAFSSDCTSRPLAADLGHDGSDPDHRRVRCDLVGRLSRGRCQRPESLPGATSLGVVSFPTYRLFLLGAAIVVAVLSVPPARANTGRSAREGERR